MKKMLLEHFEKKMANYDGWPPMGSHDLLLERAPGSFNRVTGQYSPIDSFQQYAAAFRCIVCGRLVTGTHLVWACDKRHTAAKKLAVEFLREWKRKHPGVLL